MSKKNKDMQNNAEKAAPSKKKSGVGKFFSTIGRWARRMFFGPSKELAEMDIMAVENLESPTKMAVKTFFRRKLAVAALIILVALFLFVFIGPVFMPMNINYTDSLQANIAPNYSMLSIPSELAGDVRDINGFSSFTVGVSNANTLYMWGSTTDTITGEDYSKFPDEIKAGQVYMAAAGYDHVIAITTSGELIGWGDNTRAQYGSLDLEALRAELEAELEADLSDGSIGEGETDGDDSESDKESDESAETTEKMTEEEKEKLIDEKIQEYLGKLVYLPNELKGTLDTSKITQLVCGYQSTAMVYDGMVYIWGNGNNLLNMSNVTAAAKAYYEEKAAEGRAEDGKVKKVVLGNYYAMILYEDGTVACPGYLNNKSKITNAEGKRVEFSVLNGRTIADIAATNNCFSILDSNGNIFVCGSINYGEDQIVDIPDGEKAVALASGTRHFIALTDQNKAYAWGHNDGGQTNVNGKSATKIYAGAKQTYLVNENGEVTEKVGLRGYLFGTDKLGRDTLTRIVHGGKMTMTVGAVAVIVSTIIAIIIGCLSGYFGGWVDMLLMRVTEIFSAIPFLPFAMMLSYVIQKNPIDETTRIIIIMVMLGLLSWTGLARMIRGQVLAEREKEFVTAAKSMGIKEGRIAFKHILPNVISIILVSVTLDFAGCLLTESSLSYLGFGVQQPQPTWGNMLNGANNSIVIQNYWWQWVFPSLFLAIATISINIIGDTLRDVLDPKSSREK